MKLTVGPLPAGVYWRRRAIVGGALLIVVLMLWAQCSGPDDTKKTPAANTTAPSDVASVEQSPSIQTPIVGDSSGSAPASSPAAAPPSVTSTLPVCADTDLTLVATPEQPAQFRGAYLKFVLKVKNVSGRDCVRDLGADHQELYLQVGALKMYSSDACDAPTGSQVTTLKPSIEVSFTHNWNGKTTNNGCTNRELPPAGKYQLVGRLDNKISEPVEVQLT